MNFSSLQKRVPETEEEYVEYYQDRIFNAQKRQLYPLQEDLADWLNKTLGKFIFTSLILPSTYKITPNRNIHLFQLINTSNPLS